MPTISFKLPVAASILFLLAAGCAFTPRPKTSIAPPVSVAIALQPDDRVSVTYSLAEPTPALHFAQELGGYRSQDWRPSDTGYRWVTEANGERLERADGTRFSSLTVTMPLRYRALPKSYAPFSPFSDGSALIHTGQFHACPASPCKGTDPLSVRISAPGKIIGVEGRRLGNEASFVSVEDGTNVFVGMLAPVKANGFIAIIDPGLPEDMRLHLERSLPLAINDFARVYRPLSFTPELYVSIDARPRSDGHESTQGGTLPNQIFMHFDGQHARERMAKGSPFWLDWFFAHEAAHLFQQDKIGKLAGDDTAAWIHEGGADAMAALSLLPRGPKEREYVEQRVREAKTACVKGLTARPLNQASASGNYDMHYQCGLLIWLALDGERRNAQPLGLHALNKAFFARVRGGEPWNQETFLSTARHYGASTPLLEQIERLSRGGYGDAASEVAALEPSIAKSLAPARLSLMERRPPLSDS
jgi:hypothetical protein